MKKISRSPERHTFQDRNKNDPGRREYWAKVRRERVIKEEEQSWGIDNLEHDLRTTDWMLQKVRASDVYAQNLYAALCNNDFVKRDVYNVLIDKRWSCSWRHAGGIVADMRQEGDYIDWYCTGILSGEEGLPSLGHKPEGHVTDEIRDDLKRLGWSVMHG